MRDFTFPWRLTFGLVWRLWIELPAASGPKSARVFCRCRPGPTCVTLPSRQDGGNVRAPALSRAVCVVVQVVAVGRVRWWSFYRQSSVSARTSPRPTPSGEGVGDLADFTRQLVRDAALLLLLLLLSKLDLRSVATRRF